MKPSTKSEFPQLNCRQRYGHLMRAWCAVILFTFLSILPVVPGLASNLPPVQTVFVIVLENSDWAGILGNPFAPYLNQTILPRSSFCSQYYNPPNVHPSEPNYIWMEAGTNFTINTSNDPSDNHLSSTNHLTTLLRNAGISWKTYQEDIDGLTVPLGSVNNFVTRHCPFVFFDDVTGTNDPNYPYGISHIRPYAELAGDLGSNNIARYNFITPNLCDDGHDLCPPLSNRVMQADNWLTTEIPRITNSAAFQNDGAIFILWDEGETGDGPIGMIVLSPLAKGGGYVNSIHYTHSSTLRTMQEFFGVGPFLADAAVATDLSDLFVEPGFRLRIAVRASAMQFSVTGAMPGASHVLQVSSDLSNWTSVATNVPMATSFGATVGVTNGVGNQFFREVREP